jgi:8-oxo-dGTP pyrophosphatase MutT (NUDIX family)
MITIEKISQSLKNTENQFHLTNKAAVLIPIINIENQLHLLFQVRSKKLKWQPGDICFPGGRVELSDISPECTAKRETFEELGIEPNQITILGQLPKFIASLGMMIYPFVAKINHPVKLNNLIINYDEVESVFTVPIEWFITHQPKQATMFSGHKPADNFPFDLVPNRTANWQKRSEYNVYFYQYNGFVIWGLTAQIINSFIHQTIKPHIKSVKTTP